MQYSAVQYSTVQCRVKVQHSAEPSLKKCWGKSSLLTAFDEVKGGKRKETEEGGAENVCLPVS